MKILVTTVPGLEDFTINELRRKLGEKLVINYQKIGVSDKPGRVIIEISTFLPNFKQFKTIEKIFKVIEIGRIGKTKKDLETVVENLNLQELEKYITPNITFAVKSVRAGDHDYTSLDITKLLGDKIIRYFVERKGFRPVVNLDSPDLVIEFDVIENTYIFSIELTRKSLRNRTYRFYKHEAAINPIIAASMNILIQSDEFVNICDPMCGSGTIAIEGCLEKKNIRYICIDIDERHIKGAKINSILANVEHMIDFIVADSTYLSKLLRKEIDYIITNPPFGIRLEAIENLSKLYAKLFNEFSRVISRDGLIILITIKKNLVRKLSNKYKFEILKEIEINQGGLQSYIFVLKKK